MSNAQNPRTYCHRHLNCASRQLVGMVLSFGCGVGITFHVRCVSSSYGRKCFAFIVQFGSNCGMAAVLCCPRITGRLETVYRKKAT